LGILVEDWAIKLPVLNHRDKSISELVVTMLTEEWPLSTKGIHNRLKRLYAREVSFQATHKAIKKLYFEEILVKYGGYYKLNHDWLRQVGKFSNDVIERYGKHQTMLKDLP